MSKLSKVLVTILVIIVFMFLFGIINAVRESSGHHTPGILGLIVFAGMIGAIRAIWKKNDKKNNNDSTDSGVLQK